MHGLRFVLTGVPGDEERTQYRKAEIEWAVHADGDTGKPPLPAGG